MRQVAWYINYRPLTVIAVLLYLKDFLWGLGFALSTTGVSSTVFYQNVSLLVNVPVIFGLVLIIVAMLQLWGIITLNRKVINLSFSFQAMVWLFAAITYFAFGYPIVAMAFGLFSSVLSGYIGYVLRNKQRWNYEVESD